MYSSLYSSFRTLLSRPGKFGVLVLACMVVVSSCAYGVGYYLPRILPATTANAEDKYIAFATEVYDKISTDYWDSVTDAQLAAFYDRITDAVLKKDITLPSEDRNGVIALLENATNGLSEEQKKAFVVQLSALVLDGLEPKGRSGLYNQQKQQELVNTVQNINPESDLYGFVGLTKGASSAQVAAAAESKITELAASSSPEAAEARKRAEYAKEVLTNELTKARYDQAGAEPTVFVERLTPEIVHISITQFSPTTLDEFVAAANSVDRSSTEPTALILDLRQNIGGAIDILQWFLGPFIGNNQYAYEFYAKGEPIPYKTKAGWLESLVPYKQVVILIDNGTQSTGELMAASLKKYNVGVLVGVPTKGWGTVERVFELENQIDPEENYGMFLVHSITLRDDGQPIEGRGVEPLISIESETWREELNAHFNAPALTEAVAALWQQPVPGI